MESSTTPRNASAPFAEHSCADLIIRSSDSVNFWVAKVILSLSSPVFQDMFAVVINPPPEGSSSQEYIGGVPVVDLTEDESTVDNILRICYPGENPTPLLDDTTKLLRAARKYEIQPVEQECLRMFKTLASTHPMEIYAIACTFDIEDVARVAAQASLAFSLEDLAFIQTVDVKNLAFSYFQGLCEYRRTCQQQMVAAAHVEYWAPERHGGRLPYPIKLRKVQRGERADVLCCEGKSHVVDGRLIVKSWFSTYLTEVRAVLSTLQSQGKKPKFDESPTKSALTAAMKCTTCQLTAVENVWALSEIVRTTMDEIAAEVSPLSISSPAG